MKIHCPVGLLNVFIRQCETFFHPSKIRTRVGTLGVLGLTQDAPILCLFLIVFVVVT